MASNRTRGNVFQKNRFSKSLLSRFFICFKDGHGVWGGECHHSISRKNQIARLPYHSKCRMNLK